MSPTEEEPCDPAAFQVVVDFVTRVSVIVLKYQTSWLNTLYLSMDANFKLKQKARGFNDPPLSNGLAFMVPNGKLQAHLEHCSSNKLTAEVCNLIAHSFVIAYLHR